MKGIEQKENTEGNDYKMAMRHEKREWKRKERKKERTIRK